MLSDKVTSNGNNTSLAKTKNFIILVPNYQINII